MNSDLVSVTGIVVICYLIVQSLKITSLNHKWFPVISGLCGGILGIAGLYLMPDYPAKDPITACAVGIVSGLAATGANQIYKQMSDCSSSSE